MQSSAWTPPLGTQMDTGDGQEHTGQSKALSLPGLPQHATVPLWAGLMSLSPLPLTAGGWRFVFSSLGTAAGGEQPSAAPCTCLLHPGLGPAGGGGVSNRCLQQGC